MSSFKSIGEKYQTDKVLHHGYFNFYPRFLEPLRNEAFNMLEIGLGSFQDNTGNSPKLWKEYFPYSNIFVMDIDHEYTDEYGRVIKGDQSSLNDLNNIKNIIQSAKFIIDDGSHHPEHQILSFEFLFDNLLELGGVYIIEDIECSYWHPHEDIYGYTTGYLNIIDYFTKYQHEVNSEFNDVSNRLKISTITYGQNCIIITKQTQEEIDFYNREYRFRWKLRK